MAVEGKKKSNVPFPQFDYPGSKISPFTGKPYTKDEAAKVNSKTRVAKARKLSNKSANKQYTEAAIQRRLDTDRSRAKKKGGVAVPPPKFIRDFFNAAKPKDMLAPPNILKGLKPKPGAKKHSGWKAMLDDVNNDPIKKLAKKKSTSTRGGFRE